MNGAAADDMTVDTETGLMADPLFVGVTRPAMAFGVTYSALLVNGLITLELFLLTRNLLWLLLFVPLHALAWLLCQAEPRIFDLLLLWGRTHGAGSSVGERGRRANSYCPLAVDLPNAAGRRRAMNVAGVVA